MKIYIAINYGRNKKTKGYILDINRRGLCFVSKIRIRKGTVVDIIPESGTFQGLKGEVAHTSSTERQSYRYKSGVKFLHLNEEQKNSLDRFISNIEKRRVSRFSFI
jgi:hypothetical protein